MSMYLSFYELRRKPFEITVDPDFLWLGEKHNEALATLEYGIREDKGFLLLTGDVGTGKTVLINRLVRNIHLQSIISTVPDPGLDLIDFPEIVFFQTGYSITIEDARGKVSTQDYTGFPGRRVREPDALGRLVPRRSDKPVTWPED